MKAPIKGAGTQLKAFEEELEYISSSGVEADDDGYVRGNKEVVCKFDGVMVPVNSEDYSLEDYGEDYTALTQVMIRKYGQEDEYGNEIVIDSNFGMIDESDFEKVITVKTGDYILKNGVEWKVVEISDYDEVIKCVCGRVAEGGYPVI